LAQIATAAAAGWLAGFAFWLDIAVNILTVIDDGDEASPAAISSQEASRKEKSSWILPPLTPSKAFFLTLFHVLHFHMDTSRD
jgi:hypothetical protein